MGDFLLSFVPILIIIAVIVGVALYVKGTSAMRKRGVTAGGSLEAAAKRQFSRDDRLCKNCGYIGRHDVRREIGGGQWAALIFFFMLLVVPGILYALHLATGGGSNRFYQCPKCGARLNSIPIESPAALVALKNSGRCTGCGDWLGAGAQFCSSCGHAAA